MYNNCKNHNSNGNRVYKNTKNVEPGEQKAAIMRWQMIKRSNFWPGETQSAISNKETAVRPWWGPAWRCTVSGRNLHTDCRHARGPRWRRPPPDRWGRGSCGCTRHRRAPLPPNCSEERTSSGRPGWRAAENREQVRNRRRKKGKLLRQPRAARSNQQLHPNSGQALTLLPWRWVF